MYPSIKNLTATAAETYANVTWEYEGPIHENIYIEYGVAGSKKTLHWILLYAVIDFEILFNNRKGPDIYFPRISFVF